MQQQGQFLLFDTPEEFAAWLFKTKFSRKISRIQEHHEWMPGYKQFTGKNHFEILQSNKTYHMNNWNPPAHDIAQNITIFPDGKIAVCRPFDDMPAGIYGANLDALCIENVGNFDIGGDIMTAAHKHSIVMVAALLCQRFNIAPNTNTIIYHSWYNQKTGQRDNDAGIIDSLHKSCPGSNWFGGNSVKAAEKNFIPLIREFMKPKPVNWKVEGVNYLKDAGYTSSLHKPDEIIDFGTLGVILKKRDELLKKTLQ